MKIADHRQGPEAEQANRATFAMSIDALRSAALHRLLDRAEDRVAGPVLHLDAHSVAEATGTASSPRRAASVSTMRISTMQL